MATKYVRTTGNDSGSSGPFKTIQYGINQLNSGDTLIVGNGTYNFDVISNNNIKITTPGVTVKAENKHGAIIQGTWEQLDVFPHTTLTWDKRYTAGIIVSAADCIVDGFVIKNSKGRGVTITGDRSAVQNCSVQNIFNTAIQSFEADGVVIQYNEVNNAARQRIWRSTTVNDVFVNNHPNVCALVGGAGGVIRDNIVHDSGGEGIGVFRNSGGALVEGNISYNNSSVQLYINRVGNGLIMRNNIAFQTKPSSLLIGNNINSQPGGIDLRDESQPSTYPASRNLEIYNNLVINCNQGLWITRQANIQDSVIAHNTFIQGLYTQNGIVRVSAKDVGTNWTNAKILNNIFYGLDYQIESSASVISWNYNCFYPGNPPATIKGAFDVYADPKFAKLITNPSFESLVAANYKLLSGSPCIDSGGIA